MTATQYIVHPAAELFPMLPDDELDDLARDIHANGLIHPIVRDRSGAILDGRNRLRACELAGVDPAFTTYEGDDPAAYVIAENVNRRHLSKGQRAMAVAMLRKSKNDFSAPDDLSDGYIKSASVVLKHAPELTDRVMDGSVALSDAYKEAQSRKASQQTRDEQEKQLARERNEQAKAIATKMAELRKGAPDLADLVSEERMTLREAIGAWQERVKHERQLREDITQFFAEHVVGLWAVILNEPEKIARDWMDGINQQRRKGPTVAHLWTGDGLRELAQSLEQIAADVDRRGGLN